MRASAATLLVLAALWAGSAEADGEVCIGKAATDALACDGKKLSAGKRRGATFKPPAADAAAPKAIAPGSPKNLEVPPRIDRKLKNQSRKYLLREIATVGDLLRNTPRKSPDHAKLTRRLADDYAELESDLFHDQMDAEVAGSKLRKKNKKRAAARKKEAEDLKKRAATARKSAIKLYKRLAAQHPDYCQFPDQQRPEDRGCVDQALYYLAYEYELGRDFERARDTYLELIDTWPSSKYVPHAYLAFGELYFSEALGDPSRWQQAEQAYTEVVAFKPPKNALWGYAHYKLGYVHWNQGHHDKALDHLKKVIEFGVKHPRLPQAASLAAAARHDIVAVYAATGEAKQAYAFFKPLSGDGPADTKKTLAMMEELGQAMMDSGHYEQATAVYQELLQRNPGAAACAYQGQIVKATLALQSGKKKPVVAALEALVDAYRQNKAARYAAAPTRACAAVTASLVAETAMIWHIEAVGSGGVRGTGDEATIDAALGLYQLVGDNFSAEELDAIEFPHLVREDWPTLGRVRYLAADLLFARKRWKECGQAFYRAYQADEDGPVAGEALFAAGQCWQNAVLERRGSEGYRETEAAAAGKLEPRAFAADEKEMLGAFDRYACKVSPPKNDADALEKHCEVKFARARSYYDAHHFEEAALAFRDIAMDHPSCEASIYAAHLYLDSLEVMRTRWNRPGCLGEMHDAEKLYAIHCKGDANKEENAELCRSLERPMRDVARLDIEAFIAAIKPGDPERTKKLTEAGDRYLGLWKDHGKKACQTESPSCKGYDEVLHNAAKAYAAAGLLAKAISVRGLLLDPQYHLAATPLGRGAAYDIGANYQAIAVYDLAADYYERFAAESSGDEKAAVALSDAVVLRLGLGDADRALEDARLFAQAHGKKRPAQAAQIAFAIGAHHAAAREWAKVEKTLGDAMPQIDANATLDVRIEAHALLGRAHAEQNEAPAADAHYEKVRAFATKLGELDQALAAMKITDGERGRRRAKAITAIGEALFHFARKEEDKAAALAFPRYSGGGSEADVNAFIAGKVAPWLDKKRPAIDRATEAYMQIIRLDGDHPPPRWAIAAGAAVGAMWGGLVDDFMKAPYPSAWDGDGEVPGVSPPLLYSELKAMYQGKLADKVAPYEEIAKKSFQRCLQFGQDYQHFDEQVRGCEEWLSKRYPSEYHLLDELSGAPTRVSSGLDERPQALGVDGAPAQRAE